MLSAMNDFPIQISAAVCAALARHAESERPAECCGLLSGNDHLVVAHHPLENVAAEPQSRYFASPETLFAAMRRIREAGQQLLGIYHSHPKTAAYPSPADVEAAFYPEALYFIIALEPAIEMRAFQIENGRIREVRLAVIE